MKARVLSKTNLKPLLLLAFVLAGCDGGRFEARNLKTELEPEVMQVSKTCEEFFISNYGDVAAVVNRKNYASEISQNKQALQELVNACDKLMITAPYGECQVEVGMSSSFLIDDKNFENTCLDANADLEKLIKLETQAVAVSTEVVTEVVEVRVDQESVNNPETEAVIEPVTESTPQVFDAKVDLLKSSVNFELKTTNPAAFATLINSQKQREHYILFFVGGTRLTHSPTASQIGIGCSIYTSEILEAADLAKPIRLERKTVKPISAGVILLFEMNANSKKFNIQCFKRVSDKNSTFTVADIAKHLGTYFQVVQKPNTI